MALDENYCASHVCGHAYDVPIVAAINKLCHYGLNSPTTFKVTSISIIAQQSDLC
jgi:hypothetical protein